MTSLLQSPEPRLIAADGLTLTVIRDLEQLKRLAPEWQSLLERSAHPEPMLAPDWLLTWWQVYGAESDRQLCVGAFRAGDELVGLSPLCQRRYRYRPGIPFRRLEPLGADVDEDDGVGSEYLGLIARAGREQAVATAFARALARGEFGPWDELVWPAQDGDTALPHLLRESLCREGIQAELSVTNQVPYLPLAKSWSEYLRLVNKKSRRSFRDALRRFETWSKGGHDLVSASSPAEFEQGKLILKELHQERWHAANTRSAFDSSRFERFHELYAPAAFAAGKLELLWLAVRGQPVAAHYSLLANNKVYYYQCGRKMDVPSAQRVGIVLLIFALQRAMAQGRREFDFLGGTSPYKTLFTRRTRPLVQVRAVRTCAVEWMRRWTERTLDAARWMKGRLASLAAARVRSATGPVNVR